MPSPPRQPLNGRRFPIDTLFAEAPSTVSTVSRQDPDCPGHGIRRYRQTTARPLSRVGEALEAPGGGISEVKTVPGDASRQGAIHMDTVPLDPAKILSARRRWPPSSPPAAENTICKNRDKKP